VQIHLEYLQLLLTQSFILTHLPITPSQLFIFPLLLIELLPISIRLLAHLFISLHQLVYLLIVVLLLLLQIAYLHVFALLELLEPGCEGLQLAGLVVVCLALLFKLLFQG
jgi:hypothetical protein